MSDAVPPLRLYVGGAVPLDDGVYIVRRTDAELLRAVRSGEYCNILCPRQMGKTSAIMRIRAELRDEGYRTALFDIGGRLGTPDSAAEWYVGLLSQLSDQFGLGADVQGWWDASAEPTPNQKLLAFLRKEVLGRFPDRFVVFLDEIEQTLDLPYTDDFFLAIRSLYNDRAAEPDLRRLAFCLVGVFSPNELIKRQRTTTYNVGQSFEFHDFDPARDDLAPLERTLSADPARGAALLETVLRWTGGQPYLTASVCRRVADAGIASPEGVDRLVVEQFLAHEAALDSNDRMHFDTISRFLAQRVAARLETAELYRRILRGEPERESTSAPVVALKLSGLVKTDGKGRLRVRNKIYRRRFGAEWATAVLSLGERATVARLRERGARTSEAKRLAGEVGQPLPSRTRVFISHASHDSEFVRELRAALELDDQAGWIDSRESVGSDPLWPEIQQTIEAASGYVVVVSPASLQSTWVGKELRHALEVQKQRGRTEYPVILLSLDETRLGVLEAFFAEEPTYLAVENAPVGIDTARNAILVALGRRFPADLAFAPPPHAEPLEELVLYLNDFAFDEHEGARRASAAAQLLYRAAMPGRREVGSTRWRFIAPLGPIEAGELRWYLEQYAVWPGTYFRDRARKVEESLVTWGRLLHDAAMPAAHTAAVMQSWAGIDGRAERRFSVYVDVPTESGAPEAEAAAAKEAATALLGLPWELLHDGRGFLFQGARPTAVRRRLPNSHNLEVSVVATPIRILLVTARPEDDACGYIDHRASALPLVDAMEALPGLVHIHVLDPPTLPALREELDRARSREEPYHVVHFDGHGVYDRKVGLGALCFEDPRDAGKLERRRHEMVFTDDLGAMLRDHRVPLVFLEACQTAQAEQASESVAVALLGVGVTSVVTMSHSVLVETARRFVEAFYDALAGGARVGGAMLAGQRRLKDDPLRGRVFGAEELRLQDWFVPVLFQERDDPQLFRGTPSRQTQEDYRRALQLRLGELPREPATGFVGRSRDLLALQRLLRKERYAVVRGQGGEGKTALAAELARWMVRSHQVRRAAFVSVETHSHAAAVLDGIGGQLVPGYSVAAFGDLEHALLPVERALREQETLLVVDNMESVLLPPFVAAETPDALTEDARRALDAILGLCARLNAIGETRLVITSREALPPPFDGERHRIELRQLDRDDAVKLVERVLNAEAGGGDGASSDAAREEIDQLVDAVNRHVRTLALLAPSLRSRGVEATRQSLVELMAQMERAFPGSREQSVYASVELSLRRLSPANREKAQVLGVFQGAVDLDVLRVMMEWEKPDVAALAADLVETGLATPNPYDHLTLNPALCPYLRGRMDPAEREALAARWLAAMRGYVGYLAQERTRSAEIAATLTVLELANLFALLDEMQRAGDAEATIELATSLFTLVETLGKPRLLDRVAQARDAAAEALGSTWNHAQFQVQRMRIEQLLGTGRLPEAIQGARQLLLRALATGEQAYPEASYDLAMANLGLGQVWKTAGGVEQALPFFREAQERFEAIERDKPGRGARMASVCLTDQGDCLRDLGRLDEAAEAYEEAIRRDENRGAERDLAVGKGQLGTVRLLQRRYQEALASFAEAREHFEALNEPGNVALFWNQTGRVLQEVGQAEAAEDAYRKSLALWVRLGDVTGAAGALGLLGSLYAEAERAEEALVFYRQAVDRYVEVSDMASESRVRTDLAAALLRLRRFDEARYEILRAIEIQTVFGHAAEPWKSWDILATIETDAGNATAAAEAARKAIVSYLAYRRDGGENHFGDGRVAIAVTQALSAGQAEMAASLLQQIAADPEAAWLHPFIRALQAIIAGSRDRSLADAPELGYRMAAEILLLLEVLEAAPQSREPEARVRAQSRGGSEATRARRGSDGDRLAGVNSRIGPTSEAMYDRKDGT